jgi:hypothetical protein
MVGNFANIVINTHLSSCNKDLAFSKFPDFRTQAAEYAMEFISGVSEKM